MHVWDVANSVPKTEDAIFVDSNIWVFQAYPGATLDLPPWRQKHLDLYNLFLGRAKRVGATLAIFPTVLLEMANVIERYEFEFACHSAGAEPRSEGHRLKDYRQMSAFRQTVAAAVAAAWAEVSSRAECFDDSLSADDCFRAGLEAEACAIGIWDALHLQLVQKHQFSYVLSDDVDFVDPSFNITLLTKNAKAIKKAEELGVFMYR